MRRSSRGGKSDTSDTPGRREAELLRAKARIRSRFVLGLESNRERAIRMGGHEALYGDARLLNAELESYDAVTRRDVQLAATGQLPDLRRSIVEVYPPGWIKDEYPAVLSRTHIVRKGDTLIGIAKNYGVSVAALLKQNKITKNRAIFPGQKVVIPARGQAQDKGAPGKAGAKEPAAPKAIVHVVKKGETLSGIARIRAHRRRPRREQSRGREQEIVVGQKLSIVRPPKN